jgi:hypothetical protein
VWWIVLSGVWSVMGVCRDKVGVGCVWSGVRWMESDVCLEWGGVDYSEWGGV